MYAFAVAAEKAGEQQVDLKLGEDRDEITYWRKHHDLHGWAEQFRDDVLIYAEDSL